MHHAHARRALALDRACVAAFTVVAVCSALLGHARAQTLPEPVLPPQRPYSGAPAVMANVRDMELSQTQLRRGTWLVTAAPIMAIAGGTLLSYGLASGCPGADRRRPWTAITLGGVSLTSGIASTLGGAFLLRKHRRGAPAPHKAGRIVGSIVLGGVVGALLSAPAAGLGAWDLIDCNTY